MDRREFLKRSILLTAGTLVGADLLAKSSSLGELAAAEKNNKLKKMGLQLYSLREAMGRDVPGTLKVVADMGWATLETASYNDGKVYGLAPAVFRAMAEDLGMKVTGSHLGKNLEKGNEAAIMDWWKTALDTQVAVGCKYAVMPSFPIGKTLDDIRLYCDYFNDIGALANQRGLMFGFHNHDKEFNSIDGQVIYDFMLANTDPKKVMFELDVYWCVRGGKDPVAYINKYGKRIPLLHIKDEMAIGQSGMMDFESIFNAAYKNGMKEFYVEVERYAVSPEEDVRKSFEFLQNAHFVR